MDSELNIPSRLHSVAREHVVAEASEIIDETNYNEGVKQTDINEEVILHTDKLSNLENRLSAVENLGEISVEGGDIQIANNASDIAHGSAKIPTANAVSDALLNVGYFECSTAAATAAKVVSAPGYSLRSGGSIKIKMTVANTANDATLNIGGTGAKALYYNGERASNSNSWEDNDILEIFYNGTNYQAYNVAGGSGDGVYDISAKNNGATYDNLAAALGTNGANVPGSKRKGGMSVKFIQNIYATYSVVKTEGLDTEPTGTELQSASAVVDGVYTAAQLSDLNTAATLPATVGDSVTYYFATTTTYTKWVVTKATDDSGEYAQWRYIGTAVTGSPNPFLDTANWQSVKNTIRHKYDTLIGNYSVAANKDYPSFKINLPAGKYVLYVTFPKLYNVSTIVSIQNNGTDFATKWYNQPFDGKNHAYYFETTKTYNDAVFGRFSSDVNYGAIVGSIYRFSEDEYGKALDFFDIVNDIEEGGADKVLSAEQGKVLNNKTIVEKEKSVTFMKAQSDTYATMVIGENSVTFTKVSSANGNCAGFALQDVCKNGRKYRLSFDYSNNSSVQLYWFIRKAMTNSTEQLYHGVTMLTASGHCEDVFTYDSAYNVYVFTLEKSMGNGTAVVLSNFRLCEVSDVKDICAKVLDGIDSEVDTSTWDSAYYFGEKVDNVRHSVKFKTIANTAGGQGMAIFGNTMFRLQNNGTCSTRNMLNNNSLIATFDLGSKGSFNHANTAQFAPSIESDNTYPYLYVSCCNYNETDGNRCFVERVTTNSSTLVQTISIDPSIHSNNANVIIGDDEHIYMITGSGTYKIWKFRKVLVSEGDVSLDATDIVSYVEIETPYFYSDYVWQGAKVYNNKCYLLYGNVNKKRGFFVFDLQTKSLSTIVDLSSLVSTELEDFDFSNNVMWIVDLSGGCYNAMFND